ncbi:hypothetical protein [Ruminococcus albus]|nr:hypothetical protein [Ruminococcus albus]
MKMKTRKRTRNRIKTTPAPKTQKYLMTVNKNTRKDHCLCG